MSHFVFSMYYSISSLWYIKPIFVYPEHYKSSSIIVFSFSFYSLTSCKIWRLLSISSLLNSICSFSSINGFIFSSSSCILTLLRISIVCSVVYFSYFIIYNSLSRPLTSLSLYNMLSTTSASLILYPFSNFSLFTCISLVSLSIELAWDLSPPMCYLYLNISLSRSYVLFSRVFVT